MIKIFPKYVTGLCAAVALTAAAEALPVKDFGGGATANIEFWNAEQHWVGNPNALGRNDRVLFNFDLSGNLNAGKVTKAELQFTAEAFGLLDDNEIALEQFTAERPVLANIDLLSQGVTEVERFTASPKNQKVTRKIDVTAAVNRILAEGEGTIAYRLRNVTTEKLGNRNSAAEGVSVNPVLIQLEITP